MRDPVNIFWDNTASIANTKELRAHYTVKHILQHYHFIIEYVKEGKVKVFKIQMVLNVVDPLTKPLPHAKFDTH
jgi:hypothetical protein